jgi:hypothetical protein
LREERRLDRRERERPIAGHVSHRDRGRAAQIVAQDVKPIDAFDIEQLQHVLGNGFRFVARIRLVAVAEAAQIRGNEPVPAGQPVDHRLELAMILRPAVHAQHDRTFAGDDISQIDAVHGGALADIRGHAGSFMREAVDVATMMPPGCSAFEFNAVKF